MRPRYLELEGLQSFREPQRIDFDRLSETGLFGIFGPTGSGKSTILDAITLALYGNVHRANRGTQGIINTSSVNMRVSFTFDLVKASGRKTYRVERVYRRKKDSENSVESRITRLLEIGPLEDTVLADKQGEVNEAVIELIGLQFDDFTRSVVLPQNKFQEFLLAPKAEKTKMLERIFYLEEYGRELTEKVNRKLGRIRNKLSGIEGALSMLGEISEATLQETETALAVAGESRRKADETLKTAELEYNTAKEVWELSSELRDTLRRQEELFCKTAEIEAVRDRCKMAAAAQSLTDRIGEIERTKTELDKAKEELDKLSRYFVQLSSQLEKCEAELKSATVLRQERIPLLVEYRTKLVKAQQTKAELEKMEVLLQGLRNEYLILKKRVDHWDEAITLQKSKLTGALSKAGELKIGIEELKVDAGYREKLHKGAVLEEELEQSQKSMEQQRNRYEELSAAIKVQEQELYNLEESGRKLNNKLEAAKADFLKHKNMKQWDKDDIIKAETRYYSIRSVIDTMKLKHKDIEQLELKTTEYDSQLAELERKLESLEIEKREKKEELDRASGILEEKKKERERNYAFLLAENLKDNEPCPVCGAKDHPHPAVHLESANADSNNVAFEELKMLIEKLDLECRGLENEGIKLTEQHNNLRNQKAAAKLDIKSRQEEHNELYKELPADYRELSVTLIEGNLDKMAGEKQARLKAIGEWEQKLSELEEAQRKATEAYSSYQVESSGKNSQLLVNKKHLEELKLLYIGAEQAYHSRAEAYDSFAIDLGVKGLRNMLVKLQNKDSKAEAFQKELEALEKDIELLRKEIEKAEAERKLDNEKLSENMAEGRGFKYQKEEKEKEILALLGDKDINEELAGTEEEMTALAKREDTARENVNTVRESYEKAIKDKKVLEKQTEIYGEKLKGDLGKLEKELAEKGFETVDAVNKAYLPKEELEQQEKTVKEYEDCISKIKAHVELIEKKLSGRSINEEQWSEISLRYEELKLAKENSIADHESAKSRFSTIKADYKSWLLLGKDMQELSRKREYLEQFKNLLKGNSFIEYISEERLRYIAREASETLGTLTRHRYGLELDTENGFVIRDDANGGIRRLVTSLSGGETFLTSLALALALSSQIQLKGQSPLEFFFLDEGFGTLDSSLLDTVLDALERLSTEKRVIGLISHVPEMKSRITRRLVVEAPVINGLGSRVFMEKA